jgi:hypothetical protein
MALDGGNFFFQRPRIKKGEMGQSKIRTRSWALNSLQWREQKGATAALVNPDAILSDKNSAYKKPLVYKQIKKNAQHIPDFSFVT